MTITGKHRTNAKLSLVRITILEMNKKIKNREIEIQNSIHKI